MRKVQVTACIMVVQQGGPGALVETIDAFGDAPQLPGALSPFAFVKMVSIDSGPGDVCAGEGRRRVGAAS